MIETTYWWAPIAAASVGGLGLIAAAGVAAFSATRGLRIKRRLEGTSTFLHIAANAHARPTDGRDELGLAEQLAAVALLAEFGSAEKHLAIPAHDALAELVRSMSNADVVQAASDKIEILDDHWDRWWRHPPEGWGSRRRQSPARRDGTAGI